MKCVLVLLVVAAVAAAKPAETYSTENDNLDIEAVVSHKETHQAFLDCFSDKQACDEVQADFKKDLPEAIRQACAKCTAAQKRIFKRFLEATKEKLPKAYDELKKKYDSDGKHFDALEAAIANA